MPHRPFERLLRPAGHLSDPFAAMAGTYHFDGAGQTRSFVTDVETNVIATVERLITCLLAPEQSNCDKIIMNNISDINFHNQDLADQQ